MSSGKKVDKETLWWNEVVEECVWRKRSAKKKWNTVRTDKSHQEYRKTQHKVKVEVAKAKPRPYSNWNDRLDSNEGENNLYRFEHFRKPSSVNSLLLHLQVKLYHEKQKPYMNNNQNSASFSGPKLI
ncbi:hypothetical protein ILYODFUR_035014 [Ilyodon furcidens]|uniref:Uncharacterized protein n=1 Tax=Ilyodon furcidens TaxID=33524 RepID=A0ABV0TQK7_9TELE